MGRIDMLPDFTGVKDESDIRERFVNAAREIMCGYRLTYHDRCWDITALELYLQINGENSVWRDETTDCHAEQLNSGTWYVARQGGPAYWRIDISTGNKKNIQAGILLAQIDEDAGAAMALHKIVRGFFDRNKWPGDAVSKVADIHGSSIFSGPLRLQPREEKLKIDLWLGRREGLNSKYKYWNANLRIATRKTGDAEKLPA
jgi:hypothetical protein